MDGMMLTYSGLNFIDMPLFTLFFYAYKYLVSRFSIQKD
jgi:hypothetical protein